MKHIKIFLIMFFLAGLLIPVVSLSAGFGDAGGIFKEVGIKSGADTYTEVQDVIGTGINIALTLVGLIFLILMVYAGYLWMTARGEEDKIKKSQEIIIAAIIGLVIVLSAYAITKLVTSKLAPTGTTGGSETSLDQAKTQAQIAHDNCIKDSLDKSCCQVTTGCTNLNACVAIRTNNEVCLLANTSN